jgi:hypothetical protein
MSLSLSVPPLDKMPFPVRVVVFGTSLGIAKVVLVDNGTRLTLDDDAFLLCGRPSLFLIRHAREREVRVRMR